MSNIIKSLRKLTKDQLNNPSVSPRILFFGDSITNGSAFNTKKANEILKHGGIKTKGMDYVALGSNQTALDRTIYPTKPIHILNATNNVVTSSPAGSLEFDEFTIFYLAEAGAGTFEIGVEKYGQPGVKHVFDTVNADNGGAPEIKSVTISVPRFLQRGKVWNVSGETKIVSNKVTDTTQKGLEIYEISEGGKDVPQWDDVTPSLMHDILREIDPHLIIFKTADSLTSLDSLSGLIDVWQSYTTPDNTPEWLLLPRNPWGNNNPTYDQERDDQATYLKNLAETKDLSFIDTLEVYGENPELKGLTGSNDDVHPTNLGYTVELNYVFGKLDFLNNQNVVFNEDGSSDIVTTDSFLNESIEALAKAVSLRIDGDYRVTDGEKVTVEENGFEIKHNIPQGVEAVFVIKNNYQDTLNSGTKFQDNTGVSINCSGFILEPNSSIRLLIGNTVDDVNLTGKGYGLEFTKDGVFIISHDGVSLSKSTLSLPTLGSYFNNYSVWQEGGKLYAKIIHDSYYGEHSDIQTISHDLNIPTNSTPDNSKDRNVISLAFEQVANHASGYGGRFRIEDVKHIQVK